MPKVGGRACLKTLRERGLETPCLFTSGYSGDVVATGSFLDKGVQLLPKPYRAEKLLRKVRQLLDLNKG
jgi:FixJ family two-component response regulator